MTDARLLMQGAVDTHVHTAPDLVPRLLEDGFAVRQARELGMAAIVLKNHYVATPFRARLAEAQVQGIRVIGSIVLNQVMGGINPWAVEGAAQAGAKVVWMPTAQSHNQINYQSRPGHASHPVSLALGDRDPSVHVFRDDGSPTPDTLAVLEIIRDRQLVLATGHLSPPEVDRLTSAAVGMGIRRIISTHPDSPVINLPLELQKRLAKRGVYFERTFNYAHGPNAPYTFAQYAARIREVGIASTIMATDFGQPNNPPPASGLQMYIQACLDSGFSQTEIRAMSSAHARALLDI
ncbi:MAG: DUF6282 family protein [Chloroflexota bacterium]